MFEATVIGVLFIIIVLTAAKLITKKMKHTGIALMIDADKSMIASGLEPSPNDIIQPFAKEVSLRRISEANTERICFFT